MKKLFILTTAGNGELREIYIEDAETLQGIINTYDGLVYFGDKAAVNINSLISYQFIETEKDIIKNADENIKEIKSEPMIPLEKSYSHRDMTTYVYPTNEECPKCGQKIKW